MTAAQITAIVVFGALMFVAGRTSVRRRFNSISNTSGHNLLVRLDDRAVLHIESDD